MKNKSLEITGWVWIIVGLIIAAVNKKYLGGYSEPIRVQTSDVIIILYIITIVMIAIGFVCLFLVFLRRRKQKQI